MSKVTCSTVCISLQNVPAGFGLVESKRLIMKHLNDENVDISPYYDKNANGEVVKSTIIIQFKDASCASELLKTPFIEVEHNDELHKILITKPRSRINSHTAQKECATTSQKDDHTVNAVEFNHLQRSLFCTRIPSDMYNRRDLRYHFNRFGNVDRVFFPPNNKTFAIVYFNDHSAAAEALRFGGKIESRNCHMRIKWNRDERKFHQRYDKPAPDDAYPAHPNPRGQPRFTKPGGQFRSNDQRRFSDKPISDNRTSQSGSTSSSKSISAATLNLIPVNWNQILEKEKDIFRHPYKRCVLVHNPPNRIPGESLCSYFENLGHCGGRVVSMKRILDGILVEFEDEETAESILVNEHEIDSVSLQIFPKTIPSIYDNCFVVEGSFENVDTLKSWLECGYRSDVFTVDCHSENAIYLLKFSISIDYKELVNFAKRFPLPRIKPKIRELTRPDCVIVNGLSPDINNDIIKITFMNATKSGGGQVTMIKRKPGSSSALVYFSHWQDAANVVETSNRLQIKSTEVKVCLWYNHVARVSSKQNIGRNHPRTPSKAPDPFRSPVHSFELEIKCDSDVIEYIKSSSNHMDSLISEIEEIAFIDFLKSTKPEVRFKPNFRKLNRGLNQVTFEKDCTKLFENFLSKFSTQNQTFLVSNLNKLRKSYIWTESAGIIQVEVDESVEAVQVFARWNSPSQGGAKVTGLVHEVPEVMKWLKKKCDVSREKVTFTAENFISFSSFKILDELIEWFRTDDIRISLDKTSNCLLLEGSSDLVQQATEFIKKSLEEIGTSHLLFLHQQLFDFLRDIYAHPTTNNVQITDAIQRQLQLKNVKAYFQVQPTFVLVFYKPSDMNTVQQILTEYTARKEIQVKRDFNQITQSLEWKRLEQDIDENLKEKVRLLKDKQNSKIVLVGVKTSVNAANQDITKHLKDNIVEKRSMELKPGFGLFLHHLHEHIKANLHLAHVKWKVCLGTHSDISLVGKCVDLDKAEKWLNDQQETIKIKSIQVTEPGMSEYFQNSKGTESLQAIQALSKCVVWVSSSNTSSASSSTSHASTIQNMMSKFGKVLLTDKLPDKNVTICVVQDDITDLSCDAIINTSNEELKLKNAGISGAILKKAGRLMQQEMDGLRNCCGGKLDVGLAVTSSSANLPCKRVIHVVGPIWDNTDATEARMYLRKSVYACLSECDRYQIKSVAIPAISCGVFGGKPKDCIPVIVRAIKRYFTHKTVKSFVQEILLVEKHVDEIIQEFVAEVQKSITDKMKTSTEEITVVSPATPFAAITANIIFVPQCGVILYANSKLKSAYLKRREVSDHSASVKLSPVLTSSSTSVQSKSNKLISRSSQSPVVTLMLGDIAEMTADVLVTSCSPQNFSTCGGSVTSRALLAKAGSGLQKECQEQYLRASRLQMFFNKNNDTSLQVFDVKQTSGYLLKCKKVFHILLEEYSGSNASQFVAAIRKCLQKADDKKYSRIAFPAVGTGGMKYPYDKLATWFKEEFFSFQGSSLKNIDIVLHPSDSSAIAIFSQAFSVNVSAFPISVRNDARCTSALKVPTSSQSMPANSLLVVVKQGDILATTCDIMVCPTAAKYDLSKGKLSKKVIARAGSSVAYQCQNPSRTYPDDVYRATDGGHLNCKLILFVPPPKHSNDIFDIFCRILYCVDQNNPLMRSIVFPAIFTGNIGLPSNVVAQAMAKAIEWYQSVKTGSLQMIEIMIVEPAKLPVFQYALAKFAVSSSSSNTVSTDAFYSFSHEDKTESSHPEVSLIPTQNLSKSFSSVTITLCSNSDKNIEEAKKHILKEVKEKSLTKTIENDVIAKLTNDEEKEILNVGKKYRVTVLKKKSKSTELVISGLKDDVYKVSDSVADILLEFKEAITCAEYVTWKYKKHNSSNLSEFPLRASARLETFFKKNKNGKVPLELQLRDRIVTCTLDFGSMLAVSSTEQLQLVRSLKASASGDELPSNWITMGNDQWKLVTVLSSSEEYQKVFNKFQIFGSNVHFYSSIQTVKIERIQNPTLYKQFVAQKRKMETRMKQRRVQHSVTRELFHGTSADVCDNICKDGFDRSHCGKNATAYGKGVYFATTANYSQGYARSDSKGRRRMFLADVITGEYCQGDSSYKVPPLFPGSDSQRYDSVVNNEQTPTMFVVFKDASVYPLYIATYV